MTFWEFEEKENHIILTLFDFLKLKFNVNRIKNYSKAAELSQLSSNTQSNEIPELFNYLFDITKIPQLNRNSGERRNQLAYVCLLRILDKICRKHELKYFICFGTLLGAVRHGGFIPWDDDLDVYMPRKDYLRFRSVVKKELDNSLAYIVENERFYLAPMLHLSFKNTNLILDIFPLDTYAKEIKNKNDYDILLKKLEKARLYYNKIDKSKLKTPQDIICTMEIIEKYTHEVVNESQNINNYANLYSYMGIEAEHSNNYIVNNNDIFPLREIEFEGVKTFAPRNVNKYLEEIYGNIYKFPKILYEHGENSYMRSKLITEEELGAFTTFTENFTGVQND